MTDRRSAVLLVVLVVGQLLVLSAQVPSADGRGTLLTGGMLRTVGPFASAVDWASRQLAGWAIHWTTRGRLLAENERLRQQNEALRQDVARRFSVEGDLERLSAAMDYARERGVEVRVADVVYLDSDSWLQSLWLRVEAGTVSHNQAVVTDAGLLGRVIDVSGPYAHVQLIIDRASGVGVMVERTRRQGVARGTGGRLVLNFIPLQEDLVVGDRVLTAGIDGVYPRGIPVGTVVRAEPGSELFYDVELAPAVDYHRVDHAYLLDSEQLPEELRDPAAAREESP